MRCQKPEGGNRCHILLHISSSNPERNGAHQANHIGNNGITVTTYGLTDSGSDVTMIDPSLVEKNYYFAYTQL